MRIALCGLGKAGKQFVEHTMGSKEFSLCAVLCRDESSSAGKTVKEVTNLNISDSLIVQRISEFKNNEKIDVIIDFSSKSTTFKLLKICCKFGIKLVICPTDFSDEEIQFIKENTQKNNTGVVFAPTLTVGINMLIDFVNKLAVLFNDFDFEIIERHPRNKAKPTKTAEIISNTISEKGVNISSVRLNGYVGVHEVIATNGYEKITISHESFSRVAFANGALVAANYIKDKIGFYNINQVFHEIITNSYISENNSLFEQDKMRGNKICPK